MSLKGCGLSQKLVSSKLLAQVLGRPLLCTNWTSVHELKYVGETTLQRPRNHTWNELLWLTCSTTANCGCHNALHELEAPIDNATHHISWWTVFFTSMLQ
ncbi:unnamed protein product [Victoria cruziana]